MTDTAAASSIPLIAITDGDESNASIGTISLNKGVSPDEGYVPDPTRAQTETTPEMQKTTSASEMVTPVHQVKRSTEVNVERPSLLLGDRMFETKDCTFVAIDETVDKKSPVYLSGGRIKPSKNVTSFYFDSENPPESVSWIQMDSDADMWTPFVDGSMVPETQRQEWDAVFSSVSKLKGRNTQTGK